MKKVIKTFTMIFAFLGLLFYCIYAILDVISIIKGMDTPYFINIIFYFLIIGAMIIMFLGYSGRNANRFLSGSSTFLISIGISSILNGIYLYMMYTPSIFELVISLIIGIAAIYAFISLKKCFTSHTSKNTISFIICMTIIILSYMISFIYLPTIFYVSVDFLNVVDIVFEPIGLFFFSTFILSAGLELSND